MFRRRYQRPPAEPVRVDLMTIPSGFRGTARTARHMSRLIREGAKDFYVRQRAIDELLSRGVRGKDYAGEIQTLFRWVQRNVRYTKDPFHVELLHSPRRMLELRAGDCDDMAILLGAMLESIGHPVRLVLVGPDRSDPDLFTHVYLESKNAGRWIALDPTMPHPPGWSPNAPNRLVVEIPRGPDAKQNEGAVDMSQPYEIGDVTQLLGTGTTIGEVRQTPDGNLYQWTPGADGLGNAVGFWNLIPAIASMAAPLLSNLFKPGAPAAPAPPPVPPPPPPPMPPSMAPVPAPFAPPMPAPIAPALPVPLGEGGVLEIIRGVEQFGLPRRDPRVRALWTQLRQQGLLEQSPWMRAVLIIIWRDGMVPRPRPKTVRKMAQVLNQWGLLPAAAGDLARGGRRGRGSGRLPGRIARRGGRFRRPLSGVPVVIGKER